MAQTPNLNNIVFPNEPMFRDASGKPMTGTMTLAWTRFFNNLFTRVGGFTGVELKLVDNSIVPIYTVTGSPITSLIGEFDLTLNQQLANTVFAGPTTGSSAQPGFRSLVNADLPISGVAAGEYGQVTVDDKGIVTVGTTISDAAHGGTGIGLYVVGDILYADGTTSLAALPIGSSTTVLHGGTIPSYSAVSLTADVSGTLALANGGTGQVTANDALNALLPSQSTHAGSSLVTDGTNTSWTSGTAGTVTSVSVVTANGLAGTVATATTTPAITLSTTITGVLKGNGTTISAATPGTDYLTVLSGDATTSGNVLTLATVNSNIGSFGSSTSIPTFTVNGKGLITAASGNVVIAPAGTLTGTTLNSTVVTSSLTSVGTLGSLQVSGNTGLGTSSPVTKLRIYNNSTTLSNSNFITISNKGTNTTDNTNTYTIGGILFDGYRDVRDPSNVAGVWAERAPASAGLASAGSLVFGTTPAGGNITTDGTLPTERLRIDSSGNITPGADNAQTLGSGALRFSNIYGTTITGALTGNATTATTLQTARTINGTSFDGSANITVTAAAGTLTGATLNSTVTASSLTSVGTITSGTWTGTNISLANGGTNASLTASNGGIFYSTASAGAILAGTATAGQIIRSGASAAPTWSTATYPATAGTAANVLRSDGTNFLSAALAAADLSNGVTGSGAVVLANTPTLITPVLGAATGTSVNLSSTATATAFIPTGSTVPANGMYLAAANSVTFSTNTTEAGRINASGYLLMGATTPTSSRSHSFRTAATGVYCLAAEHSHATNPLGQSILYTAATPNDTTHLFLDCGDSTAQRAAIRSNGGLANFSANNVNLSDIRLKTDILPATSYWDKIKSLEIVTFLYKDQTDSELNLGCIAQQLDEVAPELIDHSGFGEQPEGETPYLAVYQTDLQYATIKALQEAMAKIEQLEAIIAKITSQTY